MNRLLSISLFGLALCAAPAAVRAETEHAADEKALKAISAGPIWNNDDSAAKCATTCTTHDRVWTGQWWTPKETWGKDSVCQCAHWSYEHKDQWADISPAFAQCKLGTTQTPIDLPAFRSPADPAGAQALKFEYRTEADETVNNGHTIQVNYPASAASKLIVGDASYKLAQFHFHSPSENQINGVSFPLEGHFVHLNAQGKAALVVAVLFELGAENPDIKAIWARAPGAEPDQLTRTALASATETSALLPADKSSYRFPGSLTTPPCGEGIQWVVLKTPIKVSQQQVDDFKHVFGPSTNRPLQPVGARTILQYQQAP